MSARAGTGVVVAKLPNGEWSPPAAIGVGGLGGGFNAGAEMVDFLIVLNSSAAVRSFMSAGSIQLGGNLSLAVGPLGRTGEASAALNAEMELSAMYSYSVSRGLYGGVTIEGTVLIERNEVNQKAYGRAVKAMDILAGNVDPPQFALPLLMRIEEVAGTGGGLDDAWSLADSDDFSDLDVGEGGAGAYSSRYEPRRKPPVPRGGYRSSIQLGQDPMDDLDRQLQSSSLDGSRYKPMSPPSRPRNTIVKDGTLGVTFHSAPGASPRRLDSIGKGCGSRRFTSPTTEADPFSDQHAVKDTSPSRPSHRAPRLVVDEDDEEATYQPRSLAAPSAYEPRHRSPVRTQNRLVEADAPPSNTVHAIELVDPSLLDGDLVVAIHDFDAQQDSDLSFKKGDIIRVLHRTDNATDWWTGELVANYSDGPSLSGEYV